MSQELDEIRLMLEEVRALLKQSSIGAEPQPLLLKYPEAAKYLGVGLTKLKSMVRSGVLMPSDVDGCRMISRSELERIAAPIQSAPRRTEPRRVTKPNQSLSALEDIINKHKKRPRH